MKTIRNISLAAIMATLLLSSCSIEKRRYRPGYSLDTGRKAPKAETNKVTETPDDKTFIVLPDYIPVASKEDATEINSRYTSAYSIYVVVGPRPDKKGKKIPYGPLIKLAVQPVRVVM
jgi:hypothetical protein